MSSSLDTVAQHHVRRAMLATGDQLSGVYSSETTEPRIAESIDLVARAGSI